MRLLIILLLLLPLVIAQTCEEGDGCSIECLGGDADCSCEAQNGIKCKENQFCPSDLLKNWDNYICCSDSCISSEELQEKNQLQTLKSIENPPEIEVKVIAKTRNNNLGFLALLLSLITIGFLLKGTLKFKRNY